VLLGIVLYEADELELLRNRSLEEAVEAELCSSLFGFPEENAPRHPLPALHVVSGTHVWALWPGNGSWYRAKVISATARSVRIAWLRPVGEESCNQCEYLISAGADETQFTEVTWAGVASRNSSRPAPSAPQRSCWEHQLCQADELAQRCHRLYSLWLSLARRRRSQVPWVNGLDLSERTSAPTLAETKTALASLSIGSRSRAGGPNSEAAVVHQRLSEVAAAVGQHVVGRESALALAAVVCRRPLSESEWPLLAVYCGCDGARRRTLEQLLLRWHSVISRQEFQGHAEELSEMRSAHERAVGLSESAAREVSHLVSIGMERSFGLSFDDYEAVATVLPNSEFGAKLRRAAGRYNELARQFRESLVGCSLTGRDDEVEAAPCESPGNVLAPTATLPVELRQRRVTLPAPRTVSPPTPKGDAAPPSPSAATGGDIIVAFV